MNRCLITYQPSGQENYSQQGLRLLSPGLHALLPIEYTAGELRSQALEQAGHIAIPGIHPKLVASLSLKEGRFVFATRQNKYFLKPQHVIFPELPENEDLSFHLARLAGIEVPVHGLIHCKDGSLACFAKRFDRTGHKDKIAMEDFAQLAGLPRDSKYNYSMEQLLLLIDSYCTFPMLERIDLFRRVIFNYLVGNNDMHLKHIGVMTINGKTRLTPISNCLNLRIIQDDVSEQTALSIRGKLMEFTRDDLVVYFGRSCCELNNKIISRVINEISTSIPAWFEMIQASLLTDAMKTKYREVVDERRLVLNM